MVRAFLTLSFLPMILAAQVAPTEGLRENTPAVHAFVNAKIITAAGKQIARGTMVIRNGVIESVGSGVTVPADARVWNLEGLTIYPGLIDLYSDYGFPSAPARTGGGGAAVQRQEAAKGASHWNSKMKSDFDAAAEFQSDAKAAEKLRSQGFTLVQTIPSQGIFRGQTAVVSLGDGSPRSLVVKKDAASVVTFNQGGFSREYPNSLMGTIAFIRQTWIDTDWYRKAWEAFNRNPDQQRPEVDNSLAALVNAAQGRQAVVMDASDDLNFLRAAKIGKEFSLKLIMRGSGVEYRRLDAVKATGYPVIVPLNFPDAPSVEIPEEALNTTLEELRHWDAAPENPGRLVKAGIPIALTTSELKDDGTFLAQLRKAVDRGLSEDAALAALTSNPAAWMGLEKQYGSLEKGKTANFIITDGNLFDEKGKVREVWIDGKQFEVKVPPAVDVRGSWEVTAKGEGGFSGTLNLKGDAEKPTGSLRVRGKDLRLASVVFSAGRLSFSFPSDSIGAQGTMTMSGTAGEKEIFGMASRPDGSSFNWSAARKEEAKAEPDTSKPKKTEMASFKEIYPPVEFGRERLPSQPEHVLVKNATVWTQSKQGRLQNADLLITEGKITRIGTNLSAPRDAVVIDGTGKHVTPGIIDCHSHTAVAGSVNEGSQAVTCETRIEDVIDPDDIWIYRQLAGGTTIANVLHGSANPIGGQNAVLKWRWGSLGDDLVLKTAPVGVKFALGENVKRSNSNAPQGSAVRYPATRMGVEQIIRDRFRAAQDYDRSWKEWEKDKSKIPPRRDLELEALSEMLSGKRLIHSHCYRQDEILMLIRVAEDFGIKIATFQHVLEGYKVAEAIAKHGAGASTFSDWWAYKIEAWDAIPGNGPLMNQEGVVVSYNSDDSQLASRLNWEAAKALEFGLSEEDALNFVTMNPAKQLHIENRVGSLEPGKDADFVIWNGNPLSTFTKCEQTWVDGKKYFDLEEDRRMEKEIEHERAVLIQKILRSKKESGPAAPGGMRGGRRPNEIENESCIKEIIHEN